MNVLKHECPETRVFISGLAFYFKLRNLNSKSAPSCAVHASNFKFRYIVQFPYLLLHQAIPFVFVC